MSVRCHCGRFKAGWFCQRCWDRAVISLRIRIHVAFEAAGLCHPGCVWWPT